MDRNSTGSEKRAVMRAPIHVKSLRSAWRDDQAFFVALARRDVGIAELGPGLRARVARRLPVVHAQVRAAALALFSALLDGIVK